MECVSEDESYLEDTSFYEECEIASTGDPLETDILASVTETECNENRNCEFREVENDDGSFVGADDSGNCTCSKDTPTDSAILDGYRSRFKRQTGEIYSIGGSPICRVQRAKRGKPRGMCDMLINVRSREYDRSTRIAALRDLTFNIEQDPAICGLFADGCI